MRLKFLGVELEEEGAESCRLDRFRCGKKHENANVFYRIFFKVDVSNRAKDVGLVLIFQRLN